MPAHKMSPLVTPGERQPGRCQKNFYIYAFCVKSNVYLFDFVIQKFQTLMHNNLSIDENTLSTNYINNYHVFSILPHVLIAMFFFCAGVDPNRRHEGQHHRHGDQPPRAGHQVLASKAGGHASDPGAAARVHVA